MAGETMQTIQWFPGHMTKTRRMIAANLKLVDGVVELLDARIPLSSQNPDMDRMRHGKPRLLLLNKADMADPNATAQWLRFYRKQGIVAISADCRSGKGIQQFSAAIREQLLPDLIEKRQVQGKVGMPIRLMVVGIPNVGKSSFINRVAQSKRAKTEDRPGVTRRTQWVKIANDMELLDMPGVLWPKFDDQEVAKRLAFTGAIRDEIMDIESLAGLLLQYLAQHYPKSIQDRYHLDAEDCARGIENCFDLLETVGRKRGMLISGGEINTERAAVMVLDEFRAGKLGRITLDLLPESVTT